MFVFYDGLITHGNRKGPGLGMHRYTLHKLEMHALDHALDKEIFFIQQMQGSANLQVEREPWNGEAVPRTDGDVESIPCRKSQYCLSLSV